MKAIIATDLGTPGATVSVAETVAPPFATPTPVVFTEKFPSASMIWCKRDLDDTAKSFAKAYRRNIESCMNTVLRRHRGLETTIGKRRQTLVLDMTDHRDEDELVDTLKTYLKGRGIDNG